jgi:hypothetical protein
MLVENSTNSSKWTDERVYEGIASATDDTAEQVAKKINSLKGLNDVDEDQLESLFESIFLDLTKKILQRKIDPSNVRSISDALRETAQFHYTEWSPESALVSSINERLSAYGVDGQIKLDEITLTRGNLNDLQFDDLFLLFVDIIICRLQYEMNEMVLYVENNFEDDHGMFSEFNDDRPLTFSNVRNDANEIIGLVARAIYEQQFQLLISYSRHFGPVKKRDVKLLFQVSGKYGRGEHVTALETLRQKWNELIESREDKSFEDQVLVTWLYESLVVESEKFLPFYELQFPMGNVDEVPFEVFRLDDTLDIGRVLSEVVAIVVDNNLFEALALLDENAPSSEQLEEFVKPLTEVFRPLSEFISSLGIGVSGIRAEVSPHIADWAIGKGVELRFETPNSETNFEELSTAQQFWVRAGMWLIAAQKAGTRVLILADEPDRSLHERAAFNVMESLAGSGLDIIVSSHSVAALRTRNAVLHHLEVGPDGRRTLSEVAVGEDVLVAAERFGTTPYDLLSLKRMMILVEGAHDAAVVNRLLGLSENKLLGDRVLVAPMRGVKNVVSAADSVLVTEFSELNILVVVDNGRNEVFKPILAELRERDAAGASETELKQILTAHRVGSEASFEERMLFDLLERAIHRGILRRLDLFALSVGDVVELLPATGFSSSVGWEELRREYRLSGLRTDFKSWLRETHQISVSVRTVQKAFDNSDSVHPELVRLLQQIELGCMAGKEI